MYCTFLCFTCHNEIGELKLGKSSLCIFIHLYVVLSLKSSNILQTTHSFHTEYTVFYPLEWLTEFYTRVIQQVKLDLPLL